MRGRLLKFFEFFKGEGKETKEFCVNCGQRTVHELVKDEQGEYWKVCKKCGRKEYVGVLR